MSAPAFLPAATHSYLERAAESLREAITSAASPSATPMPTSRRCGRRPRCWRRVPSRCWRAGDGRQKNAWVLLTEVAPEFTEWASFFAAGAGKRAAAESGFAARGHRAGGRRPGAGRRPFPGAGGDLAGPDRARSRSGLPEEPAVSDPFVHLHVASGYSLQYGASHPHVLVERAAEQEMDTLALTDRDGTYGAVRFVKAAMAAASGRSWVSTWPSPPRRLRRPRGLDPRTPTRGGASRDARLPRVTFLASGKAGWAAVCRLVSATHHAGERGTPVCTPELVAEHVAGRDVRVLLGPTSELGRAATLRRDDLGGAVLRRWLDLVGPEQLVVEVVSHRLPGSGTRVLAARRPDGGAGPLGPRLGPGAGRALQRGPVRRPPRRPDDRRTRRRPSPGADGRPPPRPPQRRGLHEVRQADARGRRGDQPLRRPDTATEAPPTCSRRPARSPTSACSTRGPTWGSGRCTSRSSRSAFADPAVVFRPRVGLGSVDDWPPKPTEPPLRPSGQFRTRSATARSRDLETARCEAASGGGTGLLLVSGSGSGSTTSSRRSTSSASRRTSSPSATSPR